MSTAATSGTLPTGPQPPWETVPWPPGPRSLVPYWLYTSQEVYDRERERVFRPAWNYVGLEAELPEPGSYIRSWCGDLPVVVVRDRRDGTINCLLNRCGHRGALLCQEPRGCGTTLACPYHQWTFTQQGRLTGIPFQRGRGGQGGMPADFDASGHGLPRAEVAVRNGVIFASVAPEEPDLAAWLGPEMTGWFDRTMDGRPLRILGRHVQRIRANWKLYALENLRDPYHGGILHVFFVTFGLARADQPGGVRTDAAGRHSVLFHHRTEDNTAGATSEVTSYRRGLSLRDERILEQWPERDGPSTVMQALWPNMVIGTQNNSLNVRQIVPRGPGEFDLAWTFFGYADDPPELERHRIRQSALQGPAGYISIDDAEVLTMVQDGAGVDPAGFAVIEMGGRGTGNADTVITEVAIRSAYSYYRDRMGL
jgi:salicylate 5-hydroxylase large subunit